MKKNIFTLLTLLLSISELILTAKKPVKMALMQSKLEKMRLKQLFLYVSFGYTFLLVALASLLVTLFLAIAPEHRLIAFSITTILFMSIALFCLIKSTLTYKRTFLFGAKPLMLSDITDKEP